MSSSRDVFIFARRDLIPSLFQTYLRHLRDTSMLLADILARDANSILLDSYENMDQATSDPVSSLG